MKEVLKFSASWCGPCQRLSNAIKDMGDVPVDIKEIDIDDNLDLAAQYSVRSVPTMVMLENGVEVGRMTGAMPVGKVKEFLNG